MGLSTPKPYPELDPIILHGFREEWVQPVRGRGVGCAG
jgi:hypothetical protein